MKTRESATLAIFGLYVVGCTAPSANEAVSVAPVAESEPLADVAGSITAPVTSTTTTSTSTSTANRDICLDTAIPEMVRLTNMILTNRGTRSAFLYAADGTVSLRSPNASDGYALTKIRKLYPSAVPSVSFDVAFREYEKRLQATAEPAFMDATCGRPYPYFAVPFRWPTEEAAAKALDPFFRWSQHRFLPAKDCSSSFLQQQGTSLPAGTKCLFADPNWAGKDSNPLVWPQQFGGAPSYNWGGTTSDAFPVTADPDTTFDATTGATTVTMTVYRASGVSTFMTLGDTAGFRITYGGVDQGVWEAQVTSATSTGSRATFLLKHRL